MGFLQALGEDPDQEAPPRRAGLIVFLGTLARREFVGVSHGDRDLVGRLLGESVELVSQGGHPTGQGLSYPLRSQSHRPVLDLLPHLPQLFAGTGYRSGLRGRSNRNSRSNSGPVPSVEGRERNTRLPGGLSLGCGLG